MTSKQENFFSDVSDSKQQKQRTYDFDFAVTGK
jgi:hypothetical protein